MNTAAPFGRGERIAWTAAAAFVLGWALASLLWPPGLDQGIFAWVADAIRRGGMPYRDAWDVKGPVIHALYALALAATGGAFWSLRVLDLAGLAVGMGSVYVLVQRLSAAAGFGGTAALRAGGLAAFWLALSHASGGYWNAAQPDAFAAWLWLAALARARPQQPATWFALGLLCAVAALLKPPFASIGALLVADRIWRARPGARRAAALRDGGLALAGLGAGLALAALVFAARAALGDFLEVQLVFNPTLHRSAYRSLGAAQTLAVLGRWAAQPHVAVAALLCGGELVAGWRAGGEPRRDALLLAAALVLALALVVLQNQYFPYHFLPAQALLVAGAAAGALRAASGPRSRAWAGVLAAAALTIAAGVRPAAQVADALRRASGALSREQYLSRFAMGSYSFADMERIAAHVRAQTAAGDRILVWGFESGLYVLADRAASTRFGFPYPLIRGGGTALEARYLDEFRARLRATPPAYVLVFAQQLAPDLPAANREMLADFERVLARCYERDPQLAGRKLVAWRRTAGADCPGSR